MLEWLSSNKEWFLSGLGVMIIGSVLALWKKGFGKKDAPPNASAANYVNIVNNVGTAVESPPNHGGGEPEKGVCTDAQVRRIKDSTRILFIDDDERFKVVKILRNSGWTNTSLVKDVASLDDRVVADADIFFVDIQGVGLRLGFKDEGLGLAAALKERFPDKKLVIYSAEPRGERFHRALRRADEALEKNADPYEFQQLVERFAGLI